MTKKNYQSESEEDKTESEDLSSEETDTETESEDEIDEIRKNIIDAEFTNKVFETITESKVTKNEPPTVPQKETKQEENKKSAVIVLNRNGHIAIPKRSNTRNRTVPTRKTKAV